MYNTETVQANATLLNQKFVNMLSSGNTKLAEEAGTAFIRSIVRQEAAVRMVLPPQPLQDDEIDRDVDSDEPRKIIEKEPDSSATYVQFDGTPRAMAGCGRRRPVPCWNWRTPGQSPNSRTSGWRCCSFVRIRRSIRRCIRP